MDQDGMVKKISHASSLLRYFQHRKGKENLYFKNPTLLCTCCKCMSTVQHVRCTVCNVSRQMLEFLKVYRTSTLFDFISSIVRERLQYCSALLTLLGRACVCKNKGVYKQKTLNILGPDFELFTLRTLTSWTRYFYSRNPPQQESYA